MTKVKMKVTRTRRARRVGFGGVRGGWDWVGVMCLL